MCTGKTRTVYDEYIVDGYSHSQKYSSYYINQNQVTQNFIHFYQKFKWNDRDSSFFVQDWEKNLKNNLFP